MSKKWKTIYTLYRYIGILFLLETVGAGVLGCYEIMIISFLLFLHCKQYQENKLLWKAIQQVHDHGLFSRVSIRMQLRDLIHDLRRFL
jgi:hypothetical protein